MMQVSLRSMGLAFPNASQFATVICLATNLSTAIFLTTLFLPIQFVCGQNGAQNGIQNDLTVTEVTGKLVNWRGNAMEVTDNAGKKKTIIIPNDLQKIAYMGTAKLEWIKPTLFARFSTELDSKFEASKAITEIELFQPTNDRRRNFNEEEIKRNVPGVYPAGVPKGTNLLDDKKPKEAAPQVQRYNIVGQIMMIDKENFLIQAGTARLKITLTDKTKISVNFNRLDLAKAGDAVKIDGFYSPKSPDQVLAQNLLVTGAAPLSIEEQVKDGVGSKPSKSSKNAKANKKETEKKPAEKGKKDPATSDKN